LQGFWIIAENVAILFAMIALGFAAAKWKYIREAEKAKDVIATLILKITLPLLIVTSLLKNNLNADLIFNALTIVVITAVVVPLTFFASWWIGKMFKIPKATLVVHSCLTAFGNVVFLGYPLLLALYGEEGLFYTAIYAMINDAFVYTMGIFLIAKHGTKHQGGVSLKRMINPLTISFVVAVVLMAAKMGVVAYMSRSMGAEQAQTAVGDFTNAIFQPFSTIGHCTVPLAMLFIGFILAEVKIKDVFTPLTKFLPVVLKLIIMPMLMILALRPFGIAPTVLGVAVMQMAMPSQTMVSVFAREYGADSRYSAEGTFLSILCSVVTLPLVYRLLEIMA